MDEEYQTPPAPEHIFRLRATEGGVRLDRYVAEHVPDLSRSAVQRLIGEGEITVNADVVRPAFKLRQGDQIVVRVPPPEPTEVIPQDIPLNILYEDGDILVLDKSPGMVVHPGSGNPDGTLVNAILAHCPDLQGIGGKLRPGIVHRLDKDTSGVIVVAKHDKAIRYLQRQFKNRTVAKVYMALVIGNLSTADGFIEAPIGRHPVHRQRMAVIASGRESRTRWHVTQRFQDTQGNVYSLLDVNLLTGRTHQIRVHLAWLGYPLVGDTVYGPERQPLPAPRQCLHAHTLTFVHPVTKEPMIFTAPLPADFQEVLNLLQVR